LKAYNNTLKNHEKNKEKYDKNKINLEFNVNDQVYVENGNKLNRHKLDEIRIGPFPIIKKLSRTMYRVACGPLERDKRLFFHISKFALPDCYTNEDSENSDL